MSQQNNNQNLSKNNKDIQNDNQNLSNNNVINNNINNINDIQDLDLNDIDDGDNIEMKDETRHKNNIDKKIIYRIKIIISKLPKIIIFKIKIILNMVILIVF